MAQTAIIAQARMGSSRLPGKVLEPLAGNTVLAHVVRRANLVETADIVCVATSTRAADDAVATEAERCGAAVFRGDERDVLQRFIGAAKMLDADTVLRITCDCPLIDPEICDAVLRLREREAADYASNVGAADWPHGLDCEAFTRDILEGAGRLAEAEDEREHVTLWMRRGGARRRVHLDGPGGDAARQRWVLDYPEDLLFLAALFGELPPTPAAPGWREVYSVIQAKPELEKINQRRSVDGAVRTVEPVQPSIS